MVPGARDLGPESVRRWRPGARTGRAPLATLVSLATLATFATLVSLATSPRTLAAQATPAPSGILVMGVGMASPLMVDGNGTTVRTALAPTAALHLSPRGWRAGPLDAGLAVRAATAQLRLRDEGERWSAGRLWQVDLLAQLSRSMLDERLTVAGGAGATLLGAARRPEPLRRTTIRPAAEATLFFRPSGTEWALALTAQGYRLQPERGRPGGVARLVAGVARAF